MALLTFQNQNRGREGQSRQQLRFLGTLVALMGAILLNACGGAGSGKTTHATMGQTIKLGGVEHTVLVAEWKAALGQGAEARMPSRQFLVLRLSLVNKESTPMEVASMRLLAADGTEYEELADGSGVTDWLGLVRQLTSGESRLGSVLFDAPRGVYTLKLTEDSLDVDEANIALVEIPIRLEETVIPTLADPTSPVLP